MPFPDAVPPKRDSHRGDASRCLRIRGVPIHIGAESPVSEHRGTSGFNGVKIVDSAGDNDNLIPHGSHHPVRDGTPKQVRGKIIDFVNNLNLSKELEK